MDIYIIPQFIFKKFTQSIISLSKKKNLVKQVDPDRVRPTDITLQIPSSAKFKAHFGWKPKKQLQDICNDLLDYWRKYYD